MSRTPDPSEIRPIEGFPGSFLAPDGSVWSGRSGNLRRRTPRVEHAGRLGICLSKGRGQPCNCFHFLDELFRVTYPGVKLPPSLAATAPPRLNRRVEYRSIPGWDERYRVGTDRSVWRNRNADTYRPPPWNGPIWVKLTANTIAGRGRYVDLRIKKKIYRRSVALLHRAAFAPPEQLDYWARRLGPNGVTRAAAEIRAAIVTTRAVTPPPPWLVERQRRGAAVREAARAAAVQAAALVTAEAAGAAPFGLAEVEDLEEHDGYARGQAHGRARLTEANVIEARRLHREGWAFAQLAERYSVSENTVAYAVRGKTWTHLPMD